MVSLARLRSITQTIRDMLGAQTVGFCDPGDMIGSLAGPRLVRWVTMLGLVAISCGRPVSPAPTWVDVAPPAVAPGEPLQVTIRITADPVTITLVDAAGVTLAHWQGPCQDPTTVWLHPTHPSVRGDLRLEVAGPGSRQATTVAVALDVERPVVFATAVDGFHSVEKDADGEFRWTTGRARLELENPGADALLHLSYRCGPEVARTAAVRIGASPWHDLSCGVGTIRVVHIPIRHANWQGQIFATMEIAVSPAFIPAEVFATEDRRELGLVLQYAIVTLAGHSR